MSQGTGTREGCLGRVWVMVTLLALFATPIWVMLTAGLMQVFPDLMGLEEVVDDVGTRRVVTMYNLTVAGTLSAVIVLGFGALLSLVGGTSWLVGRAQAVIDRSTAKRFEGLAGDAVMTGVALSTTTVEPDADEPAD